MGFLGEGHLPDAGNDPRQDTLGVEGAGEAGEEVGST